MKANFVVPFSREIGAPDLPPIQAAEGAPQLCYTDDKGVLRGGFICQSYIPADTVMVQVEVSETMIAAMKADPVNLWIEDHPVVESQPLLTESGETLLTEAGESIETEAMELNELTAYNYMAAKLPPSEVDAKDWTTSQKAKESIIELHEQTIEGYKQSGLGE